VANQSGGFSCGRKFFREYVLNANHRPIPCMKCWQSSIKWGVAFAICLTKIYEFALSTYSRIFRRLDSLCPTGRGRFAGVKGKKPMLVAGCEMRDLKGSGVAGLGGCLGNDEFQMTNGSVDVKQAVDDPGSTTVRVACYAGKQRRSATLSTFTGLYCAFGLTIKSKPLRPKYYYGKYQ
jgi:hypothetical protein